MIVVTGSMKLKITYLAIFLFCIITNAKCQTPSLSKATQQSWSGGIEGRHGNNYYIELVSQVEIVPDSIYINGYCFSLKNSRYADDAYFWYKTNDSTYRITVKQSLNTGIRHIVPITHNEPNHTDQKTICKTPNYQGKALLVYYENNRRVTFEIESFTHLPGLRYP